MNFRIKAICIYLLLTLPGISQTVQDFNQTDKNGKKQGRWMKYYPNGKIMYDGFFNDDKPTGEFKRYYEDNVLKALLIFSKNGTEATTTLYYPNGLIASKGKYVNQLKEGKWQFFSSTNEGLLIREEEYASNKRNGLSVTYYPDSTIAEKLYYENDIRNGEWIKYYPDGTLTFKTTCQNGKLNGRFEAFFENGKTEFLGQYIDDLRDGLWIIYNKDGKERFKTLYSAGVPDNRDIDIYQSEYLDSLENIKVKIADPEKTGEIW